MSAFSKTIATTPLSPLSIALVPSSLKKIAGITKNVITIGLGKRLEIWSEENYTKYLENADYDAELKKLGI